MRKHHLSGKLLRKAKRDYPLNEKCELCHKGNRKLDYHHWDDSKPWVGVWCCLKCHRMVEAVENPGFGVIVERYGELKREVDS